MDLTPREREVLILRARGLTNLAVAHELGISPQTVKNHAWSAFEKLNVSGLAEATVALGWTETPGKVNGEVPCRKCGGTEILIRWHRTLLDCSSQERGDWKKGEHLHRKCQRCWYHWATEVEGSKS